MQAKKRTHEQKWSWQLPACSFFHELSFLNSDGEPQQSHSNFIKINETSVTDTFKKTAPVSESYPRDSTLKVAP